MAMPSSFAAGTTVIYVRSDVDFRASDGFTLKLYLVGDTVIPPVTGVSVPGGWQFTIPAASTKHARPGSYHWEERAAKSPEEYTAGSGVVSITPNIVVTTAGALKTWEERCLELVEMKIEGRFDTDMVRYQIAGRAVERMDPEFLFKARNWLRSAVREQRNPGKFGETINVEFTNP